MKSFRKILYLFLIIFTLSFSIDGEKSKVVLDKRYDTAKLKIGVTKLISKELPLEFHAESKKIYGEIDIDENDLVFVSETLDEMPSVSTTNGRKSINNIKKYLTKDIKKSPKFEYRIVEEKPEADKTEGKKYLLIDCKEQLSGVYVYVVEKGSYKVKEVYKGVFKVFLKAQARSTSYGTIHFNSNHPITSRLSIVTYNGRNVLLNGKIENSISVENGGFPERYKGKLEKHYFKGYRIKVKNGLKEYNFPEKHYDYFKDDNLTHNSSPNKEIEKEVMLYGKLTDGIIEKESIVGKLRIKSDENDYLKFEILLDYLSVDIENEITIEYGSSAGSDGLGDLDVEHSNTFKIKIDGKPLPVLPSNTKGVLTVSRGEELYNTATTIRGKDDKSIESDNTKAGIQFDGDYLKTLSAVDIGGGQNLLRITVQNRNRLKEEEKTLTIDDGNGNIFDTYSHTFNLYDSFGVSAGKLTVSKEDVNSKYYTLKISDFPKMTEMVNTNIILEYIVRPVGETSDLNDMVIKEDFITLYIKPREQNIPKGTNGRLVLYTTENLRNNDFYIKNGKLETKASDDSGYYKPYDLSKCRYSNIPMRLKNNQLGSDNWVYWGEDARILIEGPNLKEKVLYFSDKTGNKGGEKEREEGTFITYQGDNETGDSGWVRLKHTDGTDVGKGFIQFNMDEGMESLTIGFRGSNLELRPVPGGDFELDAGKSVDSVYHIKYQAKLKNKATNGTVTDVWHTVKEDTIEIIIDSSINEKTKVIDLLNPLVYYDYESSSAISNIVHNKRVHLSGKEAKTLTSGGATFSKNTDLSGKKWIELTGEDVLDYSKSFNRKHKVTIRQGSSEVVKMTDENGRTSSSTFLGDTNTITSNSRDGRGNEVMFSYDGGNKYLNFGLSKYNFKGTTITDVSITNGGIIDNDGGSVTDTTTSREYFTIKIPKFEGIHYVNPNYNIKPRQDYTKDHVFDHDIGAGEIIIDYGTVGFRDLDTRITEQSGGKGIEIRAFRKVILKSVSNSNYIIKNAELYFEDERTDGNFTYFKGTNEKATSKMLKLKIPKQETLIPKDKFIILTDEAVPAYPLKVGVTVGDDKTTYYTPIDDEKTIGDEGKNLYLNLSTRRFVETTIEFENPDLSVKDAQGQDTKEINWIRLNKTNYSGGRLTTPINNSDLWGRVRGEVIDIPVEWQGKKFENLKLQVFQENADGKEIQITPDLTNNQVSFNVPQEAGKHFVMKYGKGNNFIEFSLDQGYSDDIKNREDIVLYIRYIDGDKFLFDQRYIVKFKQRVDYLADSTLKIKNPAMLSDGNNGMIKLSGNGIELGENNNKTFDSIVWYEVQNGINYGEKNQGASFILKKIGSEEEYKYYRINNEGYLEIGLPDTRQDFEKYFNLSEYKNGKDIEQSFSLTATNPDGTEKNYRVNIVIEKFNPRYYGKVYPNTEAQVENAFYNEINKTGVGSFDLIKFIPAEFVYIDLGTNYRDYSRYMNILEAVDNGSLKIGVENKNDVEVTAKDNGDAEVVKGKIVFKDGETYLDEKQISSLKFGGGNSNSQPKVYPLYLKLTQEEYRKLKAYTTYEIFLSGNQNVFTFEVNGNSSLNKEMIFNKPLSFTTKGPSITIIPEILDFGQIKPKEHSEPLITKLAQAGIKVIIEDKLAKEFTTVLEPETEEIWIYEKSGTGVTKENGEKLKVRSITVTNKTQNGVTAEGKRQDDFIISGVLEVPNKTEPKRAEYGGYVTVNFTYY